MTLSDLEGHFNYLNLIFESIAHITDEDEIDLTVATSHLKDFSGSQAVTKAEQLNVPEKM